MNRPRLILLRPPDSMGLLGRQIIHEPLNLLTLAAVARQAGADVQVWDLALEPLSPAAIIEKIRSFRPHVFGLSAMTQDIYSAADIAVLAKSARPETIVAIGGVHASVLPERTLEDFPHFDISVFGEGENTLKEILSRVAAGETLEGVAGICRRASDGSILREPDRPMMGDLHELPLPARDLVPTDKILQRTSTPGVAGKIARVGTLFTARGCPYSCIFCSGWQTCGKKPRTFSRDQIRRELAELTGVYGAKHITIKDDTFTEDQEHTHMVGEELACAGVTWDCKTRISRIDRNMLATMKTQGCRRLHMGVESGSDRILKLIKKGITVDQVRHAFALTRELGFERTAYFIVGSHPAETLEEFEQSRKLCREIRPDYAAFSVGVPYPGTELRSLMEEQSLIFSDDWRRYNPFVQKPVWRTEHFSPETLMALQKKAMTSVYFSPGFLVGKLKTLRHFSAWKYWLSSARDFYRYRKLRSG